MDGTFRDTYFEIQQTGETISGMLIPATNGLIAGSACRYSRILNLKVGIAEDSIHAQFGVRVSQ